MENCEHAWDGDVFVNPVDYLIFLAMVYIIRCKVI